MRSISGQRRLSGSGLTAKECRGGGWCRSWLAIGVAVVVLALAACGGGGGGDGGQESGEVILGQPGPGDAGNHFPFSGGNVWRYQGTRAETGLPPETFVNTLTITGTRQVGGVAVTVFEDSNSDNLGVPEETFLVKDLNGIADFGNSDPTDTFTPLLIPFWEARFPLETGASFVQLSRTGLSLGEDLDEDGINDRVDLRSVVKMIGFEAVTVPVGAFAACAKFEQNIELIIILSRDGSRVTTTGVLTLWFAPNVGLVKRMEVTTIPSFSFAETVTEELIGFAVDGQSGQISLQVNPSTVAILSAGQTQLSATAVNPAGTPVAVIPVTWTSSNPAVASVNTNGQVFGFAFGSATITASLGNIVSNPVTVTVGSQLTPQAIEVLPSPVSVAIGGTTQLAATGRDQFNNIISGLTFTWQSANSAVASVDANGVVSGVATGTTTITASNGTLSSPPVSVTVSDFRQLALATNDLLFDPVTLKIYASVPSRAGVNGDSVAIINPETGQVESFIPVGSEPKKLALSDDGRFLYVALDGTGSVARLDFNDPAAPVLDLTFPLGSDSFSSPFFVEDMEVMPGARQTVAISRMFKNVSPRHGGVAIFDNGVQRATTTPGHTGSNVIEFSALPGILYGYNNESTEDGFRRMAVDAAGVTVLTVDTSFTSDLIPGAADIEFADGLIYATSGRVVNPEARTIFGTIAGINFGAQIEPDPNSGRVFFLSLTSPGLLPWTIHAFNHQTLAPIGSEGPPTFSGSPLNLIRWGINGLAFGTTGDQLLLVRTTLIP